MVIVSIFLQFSLYGKIIQKASSIKIENRFLHLEGDGVGFALG